MSQLEIFIWVHPSSLTKCRGTAILRPPPICHFVSDHKMQWISSFFQLYFRHFNILHLRAPLIWHFGTAHLKQPWMYSIFQLFAVGFAFRGRFLFVASYFQLLQSTSAPLHRRLPLLRLHPTLPPRLLALLLFPRLPLHLPPLKESEGEVRWF